MLPTITEGDGEGEGATLSGLVGDRGGWWHWMSLVVVVQSAPGSGCSQGSGAGSRRWQLRWERRGRVSEGENAVCVCEFFV